MNQPEFNPTASKAPGAFSVLGLQMHSGGITELHAFIDAALRRKHKAHIANLNLHAFCLGIKQKRFKNVINRAHFVYCDGESGRWACACLDLPVPPKVGLTRWVWDLAGLCAQKGYRLFLLGGTQGIALQAAQALKARYPALQVAGAHDGYFKKDGPESKAVVEQINAAEADIILVAFGMPVQEYWIDQEWQSFKRGIFIPGGGVLDYVSGNKQPAPPVWIQLKLEWFYRILCEPSRLLGRYALEIPFFFWIVLVEKVRKLISRQSQKAPPESS